MSTYMLRITYCCPQTLSCNSTSSRVGSKTKIQISISEIRLNYKNLMKETIEVKWSITKDLQTTSAEYWCDKNATSMLKQGSSPNKNACVTARCTFNMIRNRNERSSQSVDDWS